MGIDKPPMVCYTVAKLSKVNNLIDRKTPPEAELRDRV